MNKKTYKKIVFLLFVNVSILAFSYHFAFAENTVLSLDEIRHEVANQEFSLQDMNYFYVNEHVDRGNLREISHRMMIKNIEKQNISEILPVFRADFKKRIVGSDLSFYPLIDAIDKSSFLLVVTNITFDSEGLTEEELNYLNPIEAVEFKINDDINQ